MIDFAVGIIVGCTITAVVWTMIADRAYQPPEVEEPKAELIKPFVKPDNKKAAYYASVEYRNERKFVEESKK